MPDCPLIMGVGTGRFNRVSVWVSLHRLLLTSKAAPGARGAGTAVRSGRHRVRRPGASGPRSRVLGSVHASHRHTLSLKIVRKSDRFTLAIPMIGSCEASLRHGSVDGRHSGLASTFDNDVGRVNERGSARAAVATVDGQRYVFMWKSLVKNGRFGD
jgi:hypothetical protein